MNIKVITKDQYEQFIKDNEIGHNYLQSPNTSVLSNREILAGYNSEGKITHVVMVEPRPAMKFFKYGYSSAEYLSIDHKKDQDFMNDVGEWLRKNRKYILWQMESSTEDKQYDVDGNVVMGGFDNYSSYLQKMNSVNFHYFDLGRGTNIKHQCTWQSVVDLKPDLEKLDHGQEPGVHSDVPCESYDVIASRMIANRRKYIRKAKRQGVIVEELKPSEMTVEHWHELDRMIELAGEHHHFSDDGQNRRMKFANAFGDQARIITIYSPEDHGVMFCGLWFFTNSSMICYMSGFDRKYSKFNAPLVAHSYMYERAIEMGLSRYSYGGVSGYFKEDEEGFGVFAFKRGMGARVIRTFGPFNKPLNYMGKIFEKRMVK